MLSANKDDIDFARQRMMSNSAQQVPTLLSAEFAEDAKRADQNELKGERGSGNSVAQVCASSFRSSVIDVCRRFSGKLSTSRGEFTKPSNCSRANMSA